LNDVAIDSPQNPLNWYYHEICI